MNGNSVRNAILLLAKRKARPVYPGGPFRSSRNYVLLATCDYAQDLMVISSQYISAVQAATLSSLFEILLRVRLKTPRPLNSIARSTFWRLWSRYSRRPPFSCDTSFLPAMTKLSNQSEIGLTTFSLNVIFRFGSSMPVGRRWC